MPSRSPAQPSLLSLVLTSLLTLLSASVPWPGGGDCNDGWYKSCLPGCQGQGGLPARTVRSHIAGIRSSIHYDTDLAPSHDGESLYLLGRDGAIWMLSAFQEEQEGEMIYQDPGFAQTMPTYDTRCRIAVNDGNIFISDVGLSRIVRLQLNSTTGRVIYNPQSMHSYVIFAGNHLTEGYADGTCESAYFNYPTGMAFGTCRPDAFYTATCVDPCPAVQECLYVADTKNNAIRVIVYNPDVSDIFSSPNSCMVHTLASSDLVLPQKVVLSPDNEVLYVADYSEFRIKKVSLINGNVTALPGTYDFNVLPWPQVPRVSLVDGVDIALSTDGRWIYVADGFSRRILKVSVQDGTTYTLAGSGQVGSQDGAADTSSFYYPSKLALSRHSPWLYVLDSNSSVTSSVRKVLLSDTCSPCSCSFESAASCEYADISRQCGCVCTSDATYSLHWTASSEQQAESVRHTCVCH